MTIFQGCFCWLLSFPICVGALLTSEVSTQKSELCEISVNLPGVAGEVKGTTLRQDSSGDGSGDLVTPHMLSLKLADGTALSLPVRSSTIGLSRGKVSFVCARCPIHPVKFLEAKSDMLSTLKQIGMEVDEPMRRTLSAWNQDAPGFGELPGKGFIPYTFKTGIGKPVRGLLLSVEISADPQGGWYYLLWFSPIRPGSVTTISPIKESSGPSTTAPTTMSVKIPGKASEVMGVKMDFPEKGFGEADELVPCEVTIRCADDFKFSVSARSVHVMCFDQNIDGIFLRGSLEPADFNIARAELIKSVKKIGIDVDGDEGMSKGIARWADWSSPEMGKYIHQSEQSGSNLPFHGLKLTIRLVPDDANRWYSYLIFTPRS